MIVSLRLGSRTISSAICGDGKLEYIFWEFPKKYCKNSTYLSSYM
jgi:hypothetical protein